MYNPTRSVTTNRPFTDGEADSINAPVKQARPLPAHAFTSADIFELERECILSGNWTPVGFDFQIPNPGDVHPVTLWGIPLLLVRGEDNKLRAFHNICPLDGCPLVLEPMQGATELSSPYHGWRFNLQGKLLTMPFWDNSFVSSIESLGSVEHNLIELDAHIFLHAVFVDILGQAGPFSEHIATLSQRCSDYDLKGLQPCVTEDGQALVDIKQQSGNWKSFVGNFGINASLTPLTTPSQQADTNDVNGPCMAAHYNVKQRPSSLPDMGMNHLGKNRETPPNSGFLAVLYPTLMICANPDFLLTIIAIPEAPDRFTTLHAAFFAANSADLPGFKEASETLINAFDVSYLKEATNRPQEGHSSGFWAIQRHHFNRLVVRDLQKN